MATTTTEQNVIIAVCTCGRDRLLARLLDRLAVLEQPAETLALLIVDNRPNDATATLCAEAAKVLPLALHYVAEAEPGISHARNRAMREARTRGADLLAFVDDDDLPEPDWLLRLLARQQATAADIVIGNRRYALPETASAVVRERLWERAIDDDTRLWDPFGLPFRQSTCNVLIGVGIIDEMAPKGPLFDPYFAQTGGGDLDFFCRARRAGAQFARATGSIVNQTISVEHGTVRGLMRRRFRHGLSHGLLARRYMQPDQRRAWHKHVAGHFAIVMLQLPISVASRVRLAKRVIKLSWALGCWYGYFGGRYRYYAPAAR